MGKSLMENSILNFHFVFRNPSLKLSLPLCPRLLLFITVATEMPRATFLGQKSDSAQSLIETEKLKLNHSYPNIKHAPSFAMYHDISCQLQYKLHLILWLDAPPSMHACPQSLLQINFGWPFCSQLFSVQTAEPNVSCQCSTCYMIFLKYRSHSFIQIVGGRKKN